MAVSGGPRKWATATTAAGPALSSTTTFATRRAAGAWAAYALDTGAPLVQGILKPRRCRGLGAAASNVIAAVEAGDSEDAPGRRGETENDVRAGDARAAAAARRRRVPKLAKLEARFRVAADPFRAAVRPADGAARLAILAGAPRAAAGLGRRRRRARRPGSATRRRRPRRRGARRRRRRRPVFVCNCF